MGLKQIVAAKTAAGNVHTAAPQPNVTPQQPDDGIDNASALAPVLPALPKVQPPKRSPRAPGTQNTTHVPCQDKADFLSGLASSLDTMNPELAYKHCSITFNNEFFGTERDSDFKSAVIDFLADRYGARNELWTALKQRSSTVIHLL
jgi:hypothetical protein